MEEGERLCGVVLLESALDLDGLGDSEGGLSGADRNGFPGGHVMCMRRVRFVGGLCCVYWWWSFESLVWFLLVVLSGGAEIKRKERKK